MTAIRAHIKSGAVVLDEPVDLPDGTPVVVNVDASAAPIEIDPEIDDAWRAEARRRSGEMRSGSVAAVPWEEVDRLLAK
jgi:hypothetical protein